MKFRCQNCANKFSIDVTTDEERKEIFCPKCSSFKLRFAGAGYIKNNHWELDVKEAYNKEQNKTYYDYFLKLVKEVGDLI